MKTSNFVPEVKERDVGEPCFIELNLDVDIGLPRGKSLTLNMPEGTDIVAANALADVLKKSGAKLKFD